MDQVLEAVKHCYPTKYGISSQPQDWVCPWCDAARGQPCRTPKGRKAPTHIARIHEVTAFQILTCFYD